ncbi:MAG: type II toxin-antitoxin system HicA family toxin [Nitrospirota bacterium]
MGGSLRLCSGAEAVQKFRRAGWTVSRQRGSHAMMVKSGYEYTLSIPQHDELGPGLLRKLIRQAGLSVEQFHDL